MMDRGLTGRLELKFFNDRLLGAMFYPIDFAAYRKMLETQYPGLKQADSLGLDFKTHVSLNVDYQGRRYVAWEDARLRAELLRWISTYS
jgi:hypothetical protein